MREKLIVERVIEMNKTHKGMDTLRYVMSKMDSDFEIEDIIDELYDEIRMNETDCMVGMLSREEVNNINGSIEEVIEIMELIRKR